jgi:hypothetical protein
MTTGEHSPRHVVSLLLASTRNDAATTTVRVPVPQISSMGRGCSGIQDRAGPRLQRVLWNPLAPVPASGRQPVVLAAANKTIHQTFGLNAARIPQKNETNVIIATHFRPE